MSARHMKVEVAVMFRLQRADKESVAPHPDQQATPLSPMSAPDPNTALTPSNVAINEMMPYARDCSI
jgi:hypothetical protein